MFYVFHCVLLDMCDNIRDYSNPAKPHAKIICNFVICDVVTEYRETCRPETCENHSKHLFRMLRCYSINHFCNEDAVNLLYVNLL